MKNKESLSGNGEDLDTKILEFIEQNGNTSSDVIAHEFEIPINRALRRLGNLQKFGLVKVATTVHTRKYRCTKNWRDTSPV